MRIYMIVGHECANGETKHFDEDSAKKAVERIYYTDKNGKEHHGAHWTIEEVNTATETLTFPKGVTEWDKYVACNVAYADLCKVLSPELIIETAHAFFFEDEDAPIDKIWRYMQTF